MMAFRRARTLGELYERYVKRGGKFTFREWYAKVYRQGKS